MSDIILAPGLASDWLRQLRRLWSDVRATRASEIAEIRNDFCNPEDLAKVYIEPDCQHTNPADYDEDEPGRAVRQPIYAWLSSFLRSSFSRRDGRNVAVVLSDTGMGKTSLLVMLKLSHISRFWPDGLNFRLLKLGKDSLGKIAQERNPHRTVLLLDALDEDPLAASRIEQRLVDLLQATEGFRQVVLTCRTQFVPAGVQASLEQTGKVEIGGYCCNLLYLSSFSDEQIDGYLSKAFPASVRDRLKHGLFGSPSPRRVRAREIVASMRSLRMRPMLLAHATDLVDRDIAVWTEYRVYQALVRSWLQREQRKLRNRIQEEHLRLACQALAISLQLSRKREATVSELAELAQGVPEVRNLNQLDLEGRSLLNRNSDNCYRFSHYSIQEFLVASHLIGLGHPEPLKQRIPVTSEVLRFIFSWVAENAEVRLPRIIWDQMDPAGIDDYVVPVSFREADFAGKSLRHAYLRAADFRGARLDSADLRCAVLDRATLEGASLVAADLRGASLRQTSLNQSDLCFADARGCDLYGADLSKALTLQAQFDSPDLAVSDVKSQSEIRPVLGASQSAAAEIVNDRSQSGSVKPIWVRGNIMAVAWLCDGNLVIGMSTGLLLIVSSTRRQVLEAIRVCSSSIEALAGHPRLPLVALTSKGQLHILKQENFWRAEPVDSASSVSSLSWSPKGRYLLAGDERGSFKLLRLTDVGALELLEAERLPAAKYAWSADERLVACSKPEAQGGIRLLEFPGATEQLILGPRDVVDFASNGEQLALRLESGALEIRSASGGKLIAKRDGKLSRGRLETRNGALCLLTEETVFLLRANAGEISLERRDDLVRLRSGVSFHDRVVASRDYRRVEVSDSTGRELVALRTSPVIVSASWSARAPILAWADGRHLIIQKFCAGAGQFRAETRWGGMTAMSPSGSLCAVLFENCLSVLSADGRELTVVRAKAFAWSKEDALAIATPKEVRLYRGGQFSTFSEFPLRFVRSLAFHPESGALIGISSVGRLVVVADELQVEAFSISEGGALPDADERPAEILSVSCDGRVACALKKVGVLAFFEMTKEGREVMRLDLGAPLSAHCWASGGLFIAASCAGEVVAIDLVAQTISRADVLSSTVRALRPTPEGVIAVSEEGVLLRARPPFSQWREFARLEWDSFALLDEPSEELLRFGFREQGVARLNSIVGLQSGQEGPEWSGDFRRELGGPFFDFDFDFSVEP